MNTKLQQLKKVIQAANPDTKYESFGRVKLLTSRGRPARLADVLLSLGGKRRDVTTIFQDSITERLVESYWNLKDDNLDHQDGACINFLWELLCK